MKCRKHTIAPLQFDGCPHCELASLDLKLTVVEKDFADMEEGAWKLGVHLEDARTTLASILEDLTDDQLTPKGNEMVDFIQQTLRRTR